MDYLYKIKSSATTIKQYVMLKNMQRITFVNLLGKVITILLLYISIKIICNQHES